MRSVVILNKILNDLKSKFARGKKQGTQEDEDEGTDSTGELNRGSPERSDVTSVTEISELSDDDLAESDEGNKKSILDKIKGSVAKEEKKSNKPSNKLTPIHIIAIVAIAYFAIDEFLLKEDSVPPELTQTPAPKVRPRKTVDSSPEKPDENSAIPTGESSVANDEGATHVIEETVSSVPETTTDVSGDSVSEQNPVKEETISPPVTSPDIVDTDSDDEKSDENLTDKILQDLEKQAKTSDSKATVKEYVAPPDYEYKGRGLVYNCAGKHWACVDGPSYKLCEENEASTKFLSRPIECHAFNVYETVDGCEKIQNRMVSSSAKTSFCSP